ncbi:hypothetical protein BV898_18264 [Hypsibius exemplaris]|uniref:CxC5 like cysteine cluster associated with KDZ domain-containing protein n=1 Tax=Hypsibius exemplaris TaxID=2072580 RepID=A0A9X6NJP9_HYPEX|nr:hypothetical protein BV898_18264 [Hypsibius exemplaris]
MDSPSNEVVFINEHGLDLFFLVKNLYETLPFLSRPQLRKEFLKIALEEHGKSLLKDESHLDSLINACAAFKGFTFQPQRALILLPPNHVVCPRGCTYSAGHGAKRELVAVTHSPTFARVYEISGEVRRVRVIKRRCRGCCCVLEYDMLRSDERFQFYATSQPYLRITPSCYFSRPFCEHIVRTMAYGRSTFEVFATLWMKAHNISVFSRRWISTAFYRHEVEAFIRNARCNDYNCLFFFVIDAIWGINFAHCAAPVQVSIEGYPHLNLPQICPLQPTHNSIYCADHSTLAALVGEPVTKEKLSELSRTVTPAELQSILSIPDLNGLFEAMAKSSAENLSFDESIQFRCNKNLGARPAKELRQLSASGVQQLCTAQVFPTKSPRSRGYLLISRPCGHILRAVPIYKAESPSQVFLTIISVLLQHVKEENIDQADWKKMFVIYDNVCNLDRIHAARNPLPLPKPFDRLWLETKKVIDVFHLKNHRRPECLTTYNPDNIRKVHPDLKKRNTEVAEQNFSWFNRFKSVLKAVPRNHQLFYAFRLIFHRNAESSERHTL